MRSPAPHDDEHWRRQPTIIIDLSVPVEPTHIDRDRRVSFGSSTRSVCVGLVAVSSFWLTLLFEPPGSMLMRDADSGLSLLTPEPPAGPPTFAPQAVASPAGGLKAQPEPDDEAWTVESSIDEDVAPAREVPELAGAGGPQAAPLHDALRRGGRRLSQADYVGAQAAYRVALSIEPGHLPALRGLAKAALAGGNFDVALRCARRAVKRAPFHAEYRLLLGDVLRAHGLISEAEIEYEHAARLQRKPLDRAARSLPANPF